MSSFADEVRAVVKRPGTISKIQAILNSLSDTDHAEVIAVMKDASFSSQSIASVLNKRGYEIKEQGVSRFRRGGCVHDVRG